MIRYSYLDLWALAPTRKAARAEFDAQLEGVLARAFETTETPPVRLVRLPLGDESVWTTRVTVRWDERDPDDFLGRGDCTCPVAPDGLTRAATQVGCPIHDAPVCTAYSAMSCPNHGECSCPRTGLTSALGPDRDRACPLHRLGSEHAT